MGRSVEEIMQREVVTVTPETPVSELLKTLVRSQISGVPVVTQHGEIVGVVSTTDVVRLGAGVNEVDSGSLAWEPLMLPNEEYDVESAASFFLTDEDWRHPTERQTKALPDDIFEGYTVSDIMTEAVFTVKPTDSVEDAGKFLLQGRIHRALVVEEEQLKGIVTAFDLLKAFVEE
jgi:CBS domain-containing protein